MPDHDTPAPFDEDVSNHTTPNFHPYTIPPNYIPTIPLENIDKDYAFVMTAMLLSILSSIVSIVICSKLPDFRNIHGKSLISMNGCLLLAFTLLILEYVIRHSISHTFCYAIAIIIHVCFMGYFIWNTAMSFDIWRVMVRIQNETYAEDEPHLKRFLCYWLFVLIASVSSAAPSFVLNDTDYALPHDRPKYAVNRCYLNGLNGFTYFFNTPVGFIVIVNSVFLIMAIRKTNQVDQLYAFIETKKAEVRLNKYLKLFYIMGLIWFIDFLPWITHKYWTYVAASTITSLYGVIMFDVFLLHKKITPKIREEFFGIPIPEPVPAEINTPRRPPLFERRFTEEHGF